MSNKSQGSFISDGRYEMISRLKEKRKELEAAQKKNLEMREVLSSLSQHRKTDDNQSMASFKS